MAETVQSEKYRLAQSLHKRTVNSFMDILILRELSNSPLSGYDIIESIHREFDFIPCSGSVFSLLYALERDGLITAGWNQRKRIYILTSEGKEAIEIVLSSFGKIETALTKIFLQRYLSFSDNNQNNAQFNSKLMHH